MCGHEMALLHCICSEVRTCRVMLLHSQCAIVIGWLPCPTQLAPIAAAPNAGLQGFTLAESRKLKFSASASSFAVSQGSQSLSVPPMAHMQHYTLHEVGASCLCFLLSKLPTSKLKRPHSSRSISSLKWLLVLCTPIFVTCNNL